MSCILIKIRYALQNYDNELAASATHKRESGIVQTQTLKG